MSIEAVDRLEQIEARVRTSGRVKVSELAVDLAVSEMTIRRDLDMLADQGIVQRIRGARSRSVRNRSRLGSAGTHGRKTASARSW